jgi:hypothetical protein
MCCAYKDYRGSYIYRVTQLHSFTVVRHAQWMSGDIELASDAPELYQIGATTAGGAIGAMHSLPYLVDDASDMATEPSSPHGSSEPINTRSQALLGRDVPVAYFTNKQP